jgi:hypothetical protein
MPHVELPLIRLRAAGAMPPTVAPVEPETCTPVGLPAPVEPERSVPM